MRSLDASALNQRLRNMLNLLKPVDVSLVLYPGQGGSLIDDRVVAVGLLTNAELRALGQSFAGAWPVDRSSSFDGLLQAIDEADRELWRERDRSRQE